VQTSQNVTKGGVQRSVLVCDGLGVTVVTVLLGMPLAVSTLETCEGLK
jgi:hypothetical protein